MKKLINNIEPSASPAPVRCGWGRTLCAFLGAVLLFTACSDFTDIKPKGKNLLSSTTDLETVIIPISIVISVALPTLSCSS